MPGAVVLVSHDRAFLATTATRVASIERERLVVQAGDWATFEREHARAQRRERLEHAAAVTERDQLRRAEAKRQEAAARGERRARHQPRDPDKSIGHLNIEAAQNARKQVVQFLGEQVTTGAATVTSTSGSAADLGTRLASASFVTTAAEGLARYVQVVKECPAQVAMPTGYSHTSRVLGFVPEASVAEVTTVLMQQAGQ